jgi:hypothetical protein
LKVFQYFLKKKSNENTYFLGYQFDVATVKQYPVVSAKEFIDYYKDPQKTTAVGYKNGSIDGYYFKTTQEGEKYAVVVYIKNHTLYIFRLTSRYGNERATHFFDQILSTFTIN